jgi:hypothetical protein
MGIGPSKEKTKTPSKPKPNGTLPPVNMIADTNLIKIDEEKAIKALKEAADKTEQAKLATTAEESARKLAETLKQQANEAQNVAIQVINTPNATQEVQQQLIDNANVLTEQAKIAENEAIKASEERMKAEKTADKANQQAKIARNLVDLNGPLDISNMKPSISISNKVTKGRFRLVDGFQLRCPDGFVQQGTHCGRLIEISNSSFGEGDVEGFENTKQSNSLLVLIILVLLIVLAYRNKDWVRRTLNVSL